MGEARLRHVTVRLASGRKSAGNRTTGRKSANRGGSASAKPIRGASASTGPRGRPTLPQSAETPAAEGRTVVRPCLQLGREEAIAVINIYHEAFPVAQRVEDSALLRLVPRGSHEPGGWVFHLAERMPETVGFATGLHVSPLGLAYIAYLAVAPTWRGRGVGTALFRSLLDAWKQARPRPPHWLFLEVERPELARDEVEREQQMRRMRFYERLGCRFIHADFQAPPLGPGLPVVPYWILMLPIQDADLGPAAIRTALADLYREVYSLDEDHPLVRNCLESLRTAPKP